jgi:hypothetical protein
MWSSFLGEKNKPLPECRHASEKPVSLKKTKKGKLWVAAVTIFQAAQPLANLGVNAVACC